MFRIIILAFLAIVLPNVLTQTDTPEPSTVALAVNGSILYKRSGWQDFQPLLPGTVFRVDDIIKSESASLTVLCPDGFVYDRLPTELQSNDVVGCPSTITTWIGSGAQSRLSIQRGGRQDANIPYLIAPRSTLVSTPRITLVWNAAPGVEDYQITIFQGLEAFWESEISPDDLLVEADNRLSYPVDVDLTPGQIYSVRICAFLDDGDKKCTSDAEWATGINLAFTYVPFSDEMADRLANLDGEPLQQQLYAQANLLAQSQNSDGVGYYGEAIAALEQILNLEGDEALKGSPALFLLLGDLYQRVQLPVSAQGVYETALALASPRTEMSALALIGLAMTSPGDVTRLYDAALENYAAYLDNDAFSARFQEVCQLMGRSCLKLESCSTQADVCTSWIGE